MRIAVPGLAAFAVLAAGCANGAVHDDPDRDAASGLTSKQGARDGGECTGRVMFRGVVYRSSNAVTEEAPLLHAVGSGDIVDCDGTTVVDTVRVRPVAGVDVGIAIATTDADWRAIYVNEDLASDPSSWPDVLRN